jgi:hypothetical protein
VTPEKALDLIRQGEGQQVEFKQGFAEENQAIRSLCAFANAEGGTVFFGVSQAGDVLPTSVGASRVDRFSNDIRAHTQPPLSPTIERLTLEGKDIVAATVPKHARGQLFYAFNVPLVRVGATNQVMTPAEQQARLMEGQEDRSEETNRPRFAVTVAAVTGLETQFVPEFKVRQFSGDLAANLQWRIRGPRFSMEWQQASGSELDRRSFKGPFDLSASPGSDDAVGLNEMGFEIRLYWRARWRTELHRWPIVRREFPQKVLWDVREKVLSSIESDEPSAP